MEIRFAQTKDIPGLISLLKQVGKIHHEGRPDLFRANALKYTAEQLQDLLQQENHPIFVAAEGKDVFGYAFCAYKLTEGDPVFMDYKTLYIDDLCVDESIRGRGIGAQLYREVLAYGRALNFNSLTLNVWSFNENAMRFYLKCGMKPQKVGMEAIL